jgi:hypothetical protein
MAAPPILRRVPRRECGWRRRRARSSCVEFLGNDFFYEIVMNGAMKDNGMAPFKSILDHQKAESIRAYLIHRASEDKRAEAASQDVHAGEGRKLPIGLEFRDR